MRYKNHKIIGIIKGITPITHLYNSERQLEKMIIWRGTQKEYFTRTEIDPDVYYIVYADKDGSLYAVYKNDEAVWICKDVSNVYEGQSSSKNSTYKFTFVYADDTDTITAEANTDSDGYFSYKFEKPIKWIRNQTNYNLLKVTQLPTGAQVSTIGGLFRNQSSLQYVNLIGYDLTNLMATNQEFPFVCCRKLRGRIKFTGTDILKGGTRYIQQFFNECQSLDVVDMTNFDISNVGGEAKKFFDQCYNLKSVKFSEKCTFAKNIASQTFTTFFWGCRSLKELDVSMFDTSAKTDISSMFDGCSSLETLKLNFDLGKNTGGNIFNSCNELTNVIGEIKNIKVSINLKWSSKLTPESCMVFINGLSDEVEGKTLTFHADAYDRLTEEQLAVATSKGWSVVKA